MRAWSAQYTTMETASDLARLAIRTCGGQAMLRALPLERDAAERQLAAHAGEIRRLQQPGTQRAMNLDGRANNGFRKLARLHAAPLSSRAAAPSPRAAAPAQSGR